MKKPAVFVVVLAAVVTICTFSMVRICAQQNIYSVNVAGQMPNIFYANNLPSPTFLPLANQLDTSSNTLANLVAGLPVGSKVLKWNYPGQTFVTITRCIVCPGGWSPTGSGTNTLNLGEGAFVESNSGNPNPLTNSFVGLVFQGDGVITASFTNILGPGLNLVSYPVPVDNIVVTNPGPIPVIGLNAALPATPAGSKLQQWNEVSQSGYSVFTRTAIGSGWSPAPPTISAGHCFFIYNAASTNRLWIINFTIPYQ